MGYTKYVKYGNTIEVFEYGKDVNPNRRKKTLTALERRRRAERIAMYGYQRSDFSTKRAKRNFFRLCDHNNTHADSITFVTLTFASDCVYRDCLRDLNAFYKKIRNIYESKGHKEISYIGVPELTEKGRYHFHLLMYNLPASCTERERATRNLQRLWTKGYLDLASANYRTKGLAGYMAKYMGKALGSNKSEARRGYNCSRNIEKIFSKGSNSPSLWSDIMDQMVIGTLATSIVQYETPYLGTCTFTQYNI